MGSAAGLSVAFLLLPILALVPMSLSRTTWLAFPPDSLTLEWYGRVLADREWREAAATSLVVAALASLVAALLGTPAGLALGRARGTAGLRRALRTVVLLPVMVPVVLVAIALYAGFAAVGLGGTLVALVLAHATLGVPYVVLSVEAAARGLDPRLERAARSLGATAWQALWRVTLPLVGRGVLAGTLFAAIVSFDEVVIALFVSGPATTTLPRKMWSTITQDEFNPLLTAVATLQMLVALGLLGVVARFGAAGRQGDDRMPDSAVGPAPSAPSAGALSREIGPERRAGARLGLVDLTKRFGTVTAVDRLALEVEPGELVTLLGPSGCGKTTVLNLIAGFEAPDGGTVRIDGADVAARPPHRREVGMVFQDYALFPHLTVRENVAFPLRVRGVSEAEVVERVGAMLEVVRLPGHGDRLPRQLSGGQQQRIALARALVFRPRVLLMDEPFGALDRALRETMRAELRELHRALGITVVLVTHDQDEAMELSDRVAVMRAGRIQQVAAPRALYERPATAFVAGFVGESNLLDAVVVSVEGESVVLRTGGGQRIDAAGSPARVGDRVVVLLRPGAAAVSEAGAGHEGLVGVVEDVADPGPIERGRIRLDGGERLTVTRSRRAGGPVLRRGARIAVSWPPGEVRLLPPES
jgi:spermidine/putrescine ABC transporter ATP-binding subunit